MSDRVDAKDAVRQNTHAGADNFDRSAYYEGFQGSQKPSGSSVHGRDSGSNGDVLVMTDAFKEAGVTTSTIGTRTLANLSPDTVSPSPSIETVPPPDGVPNPTRSDIAAVPTARMPADKDDRLKESEKLTTARHAAESTTARMPADKDDRLKESQDLTTARHAAEMAARMPADKDDRLKAAENLTAARFGLADQLLEPLGKVSPENVEKVRNELRHLPIELLEQMKQGGYKVEFAHLLSDVFAKDAKLRGYDDKATIDNSPAVTSDKQVVVAESYRPFDPLRKLEPVNNNGLAYSVDHETGHAFDQILGLDSRGPEFMAAYNQDKASITPPAKDDRSYDAYRLNYVLNPAPAGPSEAFAEAMAHINGSHSYEDAPLSGVLSKFPNVEALVKQRLTKLEGQFDQSSREKYEQGQTNP